jgi:hypothetical protein
LPQGHYEASIELLLTDVPVDPLGKRAKKIQLKGGEEAKTIDFALVPGGVITGRIRSADGNPVVGAGVEAIRETNGDSGVQLLDDAERAGQSRLTLIVDNLEQIRRGLHEQGLELSEARGGDFATVSQIEDFNGNITTFAQPGPKSKEMSRR